MAFLFSLEPYKGPGSRYTCPSCGMKRCFSRYINTESGAQLGPQVGRCNREVNCGYHYTPRQYFADNGYVFQGQWQFAQLLSPVPNGLQNSKPPAKGTAPVQQLTLIPERVFFQSLREDRTNHLLDYLGRVVAPHQVSELCERYFIGTSKKWPGATVFWQVDYKGLIRAGKIMLYDPLSGKRIKDPYPHITWVHCVLNLPQYRLQQCFFGEHLLTLYPDLPVAIVESEKTAMVASCFLSEFIWLASGSLSNLSADRCRVLKGRQVVLFPDAGAHDKWVARANAFPLTCNIRVSDLLERKTSDEEKSKGLDLADYLLRPQPL